MMKIGGCWKVDEVGSTNSSGGIPHCPTSNNNNMTSPVVVIQVDPHSQQALSPYKDYSTVTCDDKYDDNIKKSRLKEWRRNRKSKVVDIHEYTELNRKYEEAKIRIAQMREASANNRKMLLEMSSVINALKDISIEYDHDETAVATPILNVQKKIRAIDTQLRAAMLQCGHLEQEKELQSTMIKEQEEQIKMMEERITELQDQLHKSLAEKKNQVESEKKALMEMNQKGARTSKIEAQQAKIAALEDEVRIISMEDATSNTLHQQIQAINGSNQAKYLEIQEMERKLAILRDAQLGLNADKSPRSSSKHVSFVPETFSRRSSHSSFSSGTGHSSSLASVMEENSGDEDDDEENDGIYSDDRGSSFSSRSFSTDDSSSSTKDNRDQSTSIKITTSEDDSVEIVVGGKGGRSIDVSDVSYSTEETAETASVNLEKEYHEALRVIRELKGENEKLRNSHSQALSNIAQISEITYNAEQNKKECEELKKFLDAQQQSARKLNTQLENLRQEHAKTVHDLQEERDRYAQLMEDYSKVSHRQTEAENYEKLKVLHDALVMKVGDMAEENEKLIVQVTESRKDRDQAESKARLLASEVDAINNAYKELQTEHDGLMDKLTKTSQEADSFKTKYYELLAKDEGVHSQQGPSSKDERYEALRCEYEAVLAKLRDHDSIVHASEKQKRDYAEAISKIQALEACNQELEQVREKFHKSEAQVTLLKKDIAKKTEEAKAAKKREDQRVWHLKDMVSHYKVLENEHEEVCQKLKRLQAMAGNKKDQDGSPKRHSDRLESTTSPKSPAGDSEGTVVVSREIISGYEQRIKELQKQQNDTLEELSRLEDELSQARLEKVEAVAARKDREQDLKVLLEHYRTLQRENESLKSTVQDMETRLLAEETRHSANTDDAVLAEKKDEEEEVEEGYTAELCPVEKGTAEQEDQSQNEDNDETKDDAFGGDADILSEAPTTTEDVPMDSKIGMTIAKDTENGLTMANDTPMDSSENQPTTTTNTTTKTTATNESSTHEGMESQQQHPQLGGETTAEQKGDDDDTVTRLLLDMEIFKRRKGERLVDETKTKDHASKADDASSVSNVSEGLSLDHSVGQDSPDHDGSVLSDEAPSTGWKDAKIAKLQSDLDKAKSEIWEWEQKEKTAQAQIQITEQKLVVAHREAEEAKKKQNAREGNLRDAVAQQKRLETECQQIQQKVASLEEQLEQAKRDARLHEEETKAARKRAAEYHAQFKKLQEKHENAMKLIEEQVRKIGTLEVGAK